jgi:hypothetical protein
MPPTKTAPYGSWKSPITSDLIVAQITMLSDVRLAGDDIYWLEGRPHEQGRNVIVRAAGSDGTDTDITPAGFNARSRVHEYGGAPCTATRFFSPPMTRGWSCVTTARSCLSVKASASVHE